MSFRDHLVQTTPLLPPCPAPHPTSVRNRPREGKRLTQSHRTMSETLPPAGVEAKPLSAPTPPGQSAQHYTPLHPLPCMFVPLRLLCIQRKSCGSYLKFSGKIFSVCLPKSFSQIPAILGRAWEQAKLKTFGHLALVVRHLLGIRQHM